MGIPQPIRVLVVDESPLVRRTLEALLTAEAGVQVVGTAADGIDALAKIRALRPDVVTLDVMMPRVDGWEAAARLREDPSMADVKLVLLSARAQEADLKRGGRIGVDAYLTKPFDPDELIETVRRLVADQQDDQGHRNDQGHQDDQG